MGGAIHTGSCAEPSSAESLKLPYYDLLASIDVEIPLTGASDADPG